MGDEVSTGELEGRVALVTGARYGLGLAIAELLAARGARVVLTDISEDVAASAEELRAKGLAAKSCVLDVSDRVSADRGVAVAVDSFGRLDILVNNAAMPRSATLLMDMSGEEWDATMAVNVRGCLFCIQAAAAAMISGGQGGRIINIASTAGLKPYKRRSHYCTSKAAVIALTRVAALELAEHAITVNGVAPGQTMTENLRTMVEGGGLDPVEADEMRKRQAAIPLGVNTPEDIANAVAYFASPAARTVTGQLIAVEGGGLLL